ACTHGPQARKRSATAWSVIDSYKTVKVPATSRKGLSKPQYKRTMRKSCSGVRTFLARTKALNSRAMGAVSGGRSCKRSSKSVSGSVRGNCMGCFSCRGEGQMFPPCSMPLFSMTYSLSWRIWGWGACRLDRLARRSLPEPESGGSATPEIPTLWLNGPAYFPRAKLARQLRYAVLVQVVASIHRDGLAREEFTGGGRQGEERADEVFRDLDALDAPTLDRPCSR